MDAIIRFFWWNIFLFELLIAYLPFVQFYKPKKYWFITLPVGIAVCILFSHFVRYTRVWTLSDGLNLLYNISWYMAVWILTVITVGISFKGGWWNSIFYGVSAWIMQHIFFRFKFTYEYIYRYFEIRLSWVNYLSYWLVTVIVYVALYFLFCRRIIKKGELKVNNIKLLISAFATILVVMVSSHLITMYTGNYRDLTPAMFTVITLLSLVCCVTILNSLFSNINDMRLEADLKIVRELWKSDKRQYEISKQSIDLINMKYHDLKYQLGALMNEGGGKKAQKAIDAEMAKMNAYDLNIKTGNETLDVVLTEKNMQCSEQGIKIMSIADGKSLSAMNEVDIYSLFGNALDNAAESVANAPEPDLKLIHVIVKRVYGLVKVQIENYVAVEPQIVGGFPQTTKPDKQNHGYGLKSMKYIVEKYNGDLKFSVVNHIFILEILLRI